MSSTTNPWVAADEARTAWQQADAERPRLRAIHGDLSALHDAVVRTKPEQANVGAVLDSVARLGGDSDDRRDALGFLTQPVLEGDLTLVEAFRDGHAITRPADDVAVALGDYVEGGDWSAVTDAVSAVVEPDQGPMAIDTTVLDQMVTLFGLAVEAAIAAREERADRLYDSLWEAYENLDEPLPALDEQPIALLPVRLETRFVGDQGGIDGDPSELLVRVFPDQLHADSHEEQLTDDEVLWGQNFWATLWYARHPDPSVVPSDPSASYLQQSLPSRRLREHVASIDAGNFSDAHHKRYRELKERAWKQLLDRFGRERAAYVVHALKPDDDDLANDLLTRPEAPPTYELAEPVLTTQIPPLQPDSGDGEDGEDASGMPGGVYESIDTTAIDDAALRTDLQQQVDVPDIDADALSGSAGEDSKEGKESTKGENSKKGGDSKKGEDTKKSGSSKKSEESKETLPKKLSALSFPEVPRKPESWTRQPRASLLPDRWVAIAEWEDPQGTTQRTAVSGKPVREPLPVGPSPESVAERDLAGQGNETAAFDGTEWMVDFEAAETAGMGVRMSLSGLSGFDPQRGFSRVTVLGVKATMDADEGAEAFRDLLDAHHYTDGLEFLEQGTPTNNHDESSGYSRTDDPLESMAIECVPPLVEDGDRSDGDLLARALALGPDDGEPHVFANVENADGTEQRDARHMNSALWPSTMGYFLQHIAVDNDLAGNPTVRKAGWGDKPTQSTSGRDAVGRHLLWVDAYRRHFIRYVRGRGPFPALRVGKQPYGVLPAKAIETERDIQIVDQNLVRDLAVGNRTIDDLDGTHVETMVNGGVDPNVLLDAGAKPDDLLSAGANPEQLVQGGVDPKTVLDASNVAPDSLTQDGIGVVRTSKLTTSTLESAGIGTDDLESAGVTVRSLARGEVSDQQLSEAGITTEKLAEVVLPKQAKALGITPQALERAGITPGALLRGEIGPEQVQALGLSTRAVADVILPDAVRDLGVTPKAIEDAGISPTDLLNGDVSASDLENAGVTAEALAEALLPQELVEFGITPEQVGDAVDVADLFNGDVGIDDLEQAGLTTQNLADAFLPKEVRDVGITPDSLASAGITPEAVLNGQVTPEDVVEAGLTPDALAEAGVVPDAVGDVGETLGDLISAGLKPMELLEKGLSPKALADAGVDPGLLVEAGLAPKQLVDAGMDVVELATKGSVPVQDLLEAGASPQQLSRVGAAVEDLSQGQIPAKEMVQAGFAAVDLLQEGADALGIAQGGARPTELRDAGVDAGTLREAGKAAGSLQRAGYTAAELLESGYTAEELLNGGFSPEELTSAGVDPETVESAGRAVEDLLAAGYPAEDLRAAGYGPEQLLEAGMDVATLAEAGFSAGELKDAGISTQQLVDAGMDVLELKAASVGTKALADAGVDPEGLREAGAKAEDLLDHGFDPQELLDAGFASVELEVAGVDVDQLAEDVVEGEAGVGDVADAAVEGLQYAATVLEDPDQAERDLYSFSFDPAVSTLSQQADRPPGSRRGSDDADTPSGQPDGGLATGQLPVVRPLSIDDQISSRLTRRVKGLAYPWDAALESHRVDLPPTESEDLTKTLQREAISRDVRQQTWTYSAEPLGEYDEVNAYLRGDRLHYYQRVFTTFLERTSMTDLDPRLGWLVSTDAGPSEALEWRAGDSRGQHDFYQVHDSLNRGIIEPDELVDADIGKFVDLVLGSTVSDLRELSYIMQMYHLGDVDAGALGVDNWDQLSDTEKRGRIVNGLEAADDPEAAMEAFLEGEHGVTSQKIYLMAANQAEYGDTGALRSLMRILLQFGTIHAYVNARRRLGQAYDDPAEGIPEPAYYLGDETPTWRSLWTDIPEALRAHPNLDATREDDYSYMEALREAAANYTSSTSIDPRLSEYTDSLRYLGGLDPEQLSTLLRETLDLCSHRLDAWWTSLATKRLFELREVQGTYDADAGFDTEKWSGGSQVPRATLDPSLLSSVDLGTADAVTSTTDAGSGSDTSQASVPDQQTGETAGTFETVGGVGDTIGSSGTATSESSADDGASDSASGSTGGSLSGIASADTSSFDPATIANANIQLDDGGSDGDTQADGGIGPGDDPVDIGVDEVDTAGSSDVTATDPDAGGTGPEGDVSVADLQNMGNAATREPITDPSDISVRAQSDPGLYVGGYGFVENLSAESESEDGPQYVHAPSEQHATTAAVLRSGYEAHEQEDKDGDGDNVLAVDLSADRVRAGLRLIRGVRRGQSLGKLLGYRFERRLREKTLWADVNLMQYADVFRTIFPTKLDKLERPDESRTDAKDERKKDLAQRDVVDGRRLVNKWNEYPFGRSGDLPGTGTDAYDALDAIVTDLADDIDAAGDLLTAESVHQLGQGNYERAGGSVGALANGEPLPDPQVARIPRSETGIAHRQCVLFGTPAAESGATPRNVAEPALAAWVESLLPDHGDVECTATLRWSESGTDVDGSETTVEYTHDTTATLSNLDLGPLDVLLLFGANRQETRSELEQRLRYRLLRTRPDRVPDDATVELQLTETATAGAVPMADLLELARSIRELVGTARPVTAEDLAHPTDQRGEGYDATTADTLTERGNAAQDALLGVARAIDARLAILDSEHALGDGTDDLAAMDVTAADGGTDGEQDGGQNPGTVSAAGGPGSWANLGGSVSLPGTVSPVSDTALQLPDPTLTEGASDLVAAIESVVESVPLSTTEAAANAVDSGAIRSELSTLVQDLPAGLANPSAAKAHVTVNAQSGQSIEGVLGERHGVPDVGDDDGTGEGEGGGDGNGDGDGGLLTSGPMTHLPQGSGLLSSLPEPTGTADEETVDMATRPEIEDSTPAWFDRNIESVELTRPGSGDESGDSAGDRSGARTGGDVSTADASDLGVGNVTDVDVADRPEGYVEEIPRWVGVTATVRIWGTDGLSWFERETTVQPDTDGSFSVDVDFSDVEPGTPFNVVAIVDGTVVYSATGRVVEDQPSFATLATMTPTAQSTLETNCPTLKRLLWLRDRSPLFATTGGPVAELDIALEFADWDGIRDERDAIDPATSTVTSGDLNAIDDLLAVEGLDLQALAGAIESTTAPVSKLGLDRIVDVMGEGTPDEVDFWYGPTAALGDVRARISRTLANPALYNDGAAPWLLSYHHDSAAVIHGMVDGDAVAAYLDAFLSGPAWTVPYLDRKLNHPDTLVRDLTAWLYSPGDLTDTSTLVTGLQNLAGAATDLPALATLFEGLPTVDGKTRLETFADSLRDLAAKIGGPTPSLTAASAAKSAFDADASTATGELVSSSGTVTSTLSPVAGSDADRAVRNVVLEQLRTPMTVAASYGVFGGTPRSADGGRPEDERDLLEQARALLERLRNRLSAAAALDPRLESALAGRPVPQRVEDATDRLETLFGDDFTVLPPFSPANGAELTATFTDDGLIPDDQPRAGETWLQRAAAFRENVDSFRETRSYAEAMSGTLTPTLTVGQVPYAQGDTWVGADGIQPEGGKLSLVAQFGPDVTPGTADGRVTGLFVDEWTETVPENSETTGLALNYDDPGNRAPQSVLVATPPTDGEWSLDDLAATVAETTTYMRRRALDVGDMDPMVLRMFPALYFPHTLTEGAYHTPDVNFGMLDWYDRATLAATLSPEAVLKGGLLND